MSNEFMEPRQFVIPEGTTLRIVTGSSEVPPQEDLPTTEWSSMKYWGKPTPEQTAHIAAYDKQVEAHEAMQDDFNGILPKKKQPVEEDTSFNELSPGTKRFIQIGLIGAGILTIAGIVTQCH